VSESETKTVSIKPWHEILAGAMYLIEDKRISSFEAVKRKFPDLKKTSNTPATKLL